MLSGLTTTVASTWLHLSNEKESEAVLRFWEQFHLCCLSEGLYPPAGKNGRKLVVRKESRQRLLLGGSPLFPKRVELCLLAPSRQVCEQTVPLSHLVGRVALMAEFGVLFNVATASRRTD